MATQVTMAMMVTTELQVHHCVRREEKWARGGSGERLKTAGKGRNRRIALRGHTRPDQPSPDQTGPPG